MKRRKVRLIEEERYWGKKYFLLNGPGTIRRKLRQAQSRYIEAWRKLNPERISER